MFQVKQLFPVFLGKIREPLESLRTKIYLLYDTSFSNSLSGFKFYHIQCGIQKRQWHPTPALLPGKSHGWRNLVGCSPWGHEESDTSERLHFHFSLSCIGEGNGNPLHCSCLENPRDGGAWWAAVYEVARSRTQLKRLSSSSSSVVFNEDNFSSKCAMVFLVFSQDE